jgi:nucleolar GTP-binding protein
LQRKRRNFERDLENENQGAGVYSASLKKHYILANYEWKEGILIEILHEQNVADFLEPDILKSCEELEREEGLRLEEEAAKDAFMIGGHDELTEEQLEILGKSRKKAMLNQKHRMKRTAESHPIIPRKHHKDRKCTTKRMGRQLSSLGVDPVAVNRLRSQ